jgi:hypothetical protein
MKRVLLILALPFALLGGCATTAVTRQAAFDLNCPASQVQVTHLNYATYGATGCGARASYLTRCGISGCFLMMNSAPFVEAAAVGY